ncbi:hypothetical protein ACHAW5_002375 [Stephanodiscus triporus]|uniref:CSN8/PSMD8/EIF3K domain-containing protein n=1 Tax=Stephanodiscus triporus TaxID=2934178 RepID=A0ABD3PNR6_9STRA
MSAPLSHAEVQTLLSESAYDPVRLSQARVLRPSPGLAVASTLVASESPDVRYSFDAILPPTSGGTTRVVEVTALVLLLALLRYPDTDLAALCCLAPERVQSTEPCATLVRCWELLDSCDYALFWPEFRKLGIPEYGASSSDDGGRNGRRRRVRRSTPAQRRGQRPDRVEASSARARRGRWRGRTARPPLGAVLAALDLSDVGSLVEFGSRTALVDGTTTTTTMTMIVEGVEGNVVTFAARGVSYDDVATMMSKSAARGQ